MATLYRSVLSHSTEKRLAIDQIFIHWLDNKLPSSFRVLLNRRHHLGLVVAAHVSAHQEFQVSQDTLDPRDEQVLRDHPVITDLKVLWALEETRAMKALVEDEVLQALKVLKDPLDHQILLETKANQVLVEFKVLLAPRDHKDPLSHQVHGETRVIQVLVEFKVPQAPKEL